jgi:PTS system N-acetylgalactosamine-specific IIA component
MTGAVRAIVAAHGALADGLISAVDVISGRGSVLRAVSNTGLATADVVTAIDHALDETGARIVFTDLPAGSCTMAARRVQRNRPDLIVVTGANLPMLLEFVFREEQPADAAHAAADRGREHIRVSDGAHVG